MSRVSIQMACGCTMLDMDPDARPQAMDVITQSCSLSESKSPR